MKVNLFRKESPSGMLFGIASVLGLVFTIIYTLTSVYVGSFDLSAISIIVSLGIVNGILATICVVLSRDSYSLAGEKSSSELSLMQLRRKLDDTQGKLILEEKKINGVAFHLHNIHDQLRDRVIELNSFYQTLLIDNTYIPEESDVIDVLRITKQFNIFLVNNVKDIFDLLTNDDCSVCIKIVGVNNKEEVTISTLMRDTKSFRKRRSNDGLFNEPFLWYENTAFKNILSNDIADTYFVCDDLSAEQSYVNLNSNWKKSYNATLVAPFRIDVSDSFYEEGACSNITGFLCIDNHKGNFNNEPSIETVASIVDSLYQYFNVSGDLTLLATDRIREDNMKKSKKITQ